MNTPRDQILYNKIKRRIFNKYKKHSAYRSGLLVKKYKKTFKKLYGNNKSPYFGKKNRRKGLTRWFNEKWSNQRGTVGYKYKK